MSAPNRMSGVTMASVAAMVQWVRTEYSLYTAKPEEQLAPRIVTSPADLRQAEVYTDPQNGNKLAYPFALFLLGEIALDTERGGLQNREGTRGVMTNRHMQDGYAEFETMRPAVYTYGINFRTAAYDDVWAFAHAMLLAAPKVRLVVQSDEGFRVECTLEIDPSLTIPPLDSNGEAGRIYQFDTTLRLRSYMGVTTRHRLIRNISIDVHNANAPRSIYTGDFRELLDSVQFDYHDLFDPASGVGRYVAGDSA